MVRHFAARADNPTAGPASDPARLAARPTTPSLLPPMPSPCCTHILPSPYAGFWLRVVAHLIDDLLLGIGIGIFGADRCGDGRR